MPDIELDVRIIPPREKHPAIFRAFDALSPGQGFTLINDHDPYPLRHQLEAMSPVNLARVASSRFQ